MDKLVRITPNLPRTVQIWGFSEEISKYDVADALWLIADGLIGADHTIHIMSGTHGYCKGQIGAVADRDEKFLEADKYHVNPFTKDGHMVRLHVHDFSNGDLGDAPDPVTAAMAKLNTFMRKLKPNPEKDALLLAYCCSAGLSFQD